MRILYFYSNDYNIESYIGWCIFYLDPADDLWSNVYTDGLSSNAYC